MAEETTNITAPATPGPKGKDEIALELMKFIAVTTGYGKGGASAGFSGKSGKTGEEHAEALLQLYQRCREVVSQ